MKIHTKLSKWKLIQIKELGEKVLIGLIFLIISIFICFYCCPKKKKSNQQIVDKNDAEK